jgi:hypothetical protein
LLRFQEAVPSKGAQVCQPVQGYLKNLLLWYKLLFTFTSFVRIEYFWLDGKGKKLKRLSAPQYFDYMDSFITEQLNNETLFPTKHGG